MDSGVFKKYLDGNVDSGNGKPLDCTCKVADPKVPPDPKETTGCNNAYSKYQCIDKGTFEAGESKYVFQGIFKDSRFENRSKLALRHFHNDYPDDSGGYSMSIDWSGCPKSKSENIQYTVAKKGSHIGDDWKQWVDVNDSIVKKDEKNPNPKDLGFLIINPKSIANNCAQDSKDCKIFLRIKLETPDADADDNMKEMYKYYNTHGQYYVNMNQPLSAES